MGREMMGRIGGPEVIVNAVVFVVQPEAGWVTGQMLTADGRADMSDHGSDRRIRLAPRASRLSRKSRTAYSPVLPCYIVWLNGIASITNH